MILLDIDFFTTHNIIKENDCSCAESIEFIKKNYGTKNIDATKLYDDVLANRRLPEVWKKDTILYRTNFASLKAYVDMYKRSKIVNTGVYRVTFAGEKVASGNLNFCRQKVEELVLKDFEAITNPIEIVGFKQEQNGTDTVYTYIKYADINQIPSNIKLQVSSFDGIDRVIANNKNELEEVCNTVRSSILNRIKERYSIQLRYTDETDWYDCWVNI